MPRFRQIHEIQQLMSQKELIRNIGIIAHIDHGKTTLADSLLAGAGLLSTTMAGTARVLDFLEEEQKRKITIKTANITLLYKAQGNTYIINLIDTPGHVDFTGKVTRALRIIDGAVVVVDAVEEIMAQTEIVMRQALQERVRPVLFINKVDRLITELKLSENQIQKKLDHIIGAFNDLIELYAEVQFKEKWRVSAASGTVAFGAALYGWGFTLDMAKEKGLKFSDIIKAHQNGKAQKELSKAIPVYQAIYEMIIKKIPNPKEAQAYRIEKIWDGHVNSEIGKALIECNESGPSVFSATNIHLDENVSTIASGRLFSGKIQKGDKLHLVDSLAETTVNQVSIDMGSFREEINSVSSGNLASLTLSRTLKSGETLVDLKHKSEMVPFEGICYLSEPVVTLAVEPKNPKDITTLLTGLEKLESEDPNLRVNVDRETGEYLLSGMGELHLEVAINQLKADYGFDVAVSSPRVVYLESVAKTGVSAFTRSPNKLNSFRAQVSPDGQALDESAVVLSIDEQRNVLLDNTGKTDPLPEEVLEAIIGGFEFACKAGPQCGEPIRHLKVNVTDFQLDKNFDCNEVMRGISKAIFGSFLTAEPVMLEPIYKIIITVASELANESSRILCTKRGKVTSFEQKGLLTQITGQIPVAETFGFSKELRSATSGRAFWQSLFDHWEKMPLKLASQVITDLRRQKGLSEELPKPEKFMEH